MSLEDFKNSDCVTVCIDCLNNGVNIDVPVNSEGESKLIQVVKKGDHDFVKMLLERGADFKLKNYAAQMAAIVDDNVKIFDLLLEYDSKINSHNLEMILSNRSYKIFQKVILRYQPHNYDYLIERYHNFFENFDVSSINDENVYSELGTFHLKKWNLRVFHRNFPLFQKIHCHWDPSQIKQLFIHIFTDPKNRENFYFEEVACEIINYWVRTKNDIGLNEISIYDLIHFFNSEKFRKILVAILYNCDWFTYSPDKEPKIIFKEECEGGIFIRRFDFRSIDNLKLAYYHQILTKDDIFKLLHLLIREDRMKWFIDANCCYADFRELAKWMILEDFKFYSYSMDNVSIMELACESFDIGFIIDGMMYDDCDQKRECIIDIIDRFVMMPLEDSYVSKNRIGATKKLLDVMKNDVQFNILQRISNIIENWTLDADTLRIFLKGVTITEDLRDDFEKTVLMVAVKTNNIEYIKILLEISPRSHLNIVDRYGVTPLMFAVARSNIDLVQFLLDHGADVNIVDNNGFNTLYYCRDVQIAELLKSKGAIHNMENVLDHDIITHLKIHNYQNSVDDISTKDVPFHNCPNSPGSTDLSEKSTCQIYKNGHRICRYFPFKLRTETLQLMIDYYRNLRL